MSTAAQWVSSFSDGVGVKVLGRDDRPQRRSCAVNVGLRRLAWHSQVQRAANGRVVKPSSNAGSTMLSSGAVHIFIVGSVISSLMLMLIEQ